MLPPLALLPGLLADVTMPAGPHSHADAIRTLVEAHAVVLVATKRCDDLFASERINQLQAALGLSNADSADAYPVLVRRAAEMNAAANTVGREGLVRGDLRPLRAGRHNHEGLTEALRPASVELLIPRTPRSSPAVMTALPCTPMGSGCRSCWGSDDG